MRNKKPILQGVYYIENKINKKRYVGSTTNFYNRKRQHTKSLMAGSHYSVLLQADWTAQGSSNFLFIMPEKVSDRTRLIEREQWWLDNGNNDYNTCKLANSSIGVKRRPETLEKMRASQLGIKHPEWRNVIKSKAQGGDNHWTKKKSFSTEARINMSNAQKRLHKNGYKHPGERSIIQHKPDGTIVEWDSSTKAAKYIGVTKMAINHCLMGRAKTSGGCRWEYKEMAI